jgi:hypothetical protein
MARTLNVQISACIFFFSSFCIDVFGIYIESGFAGFTFLISNSVLDRREVKKALEREKEREREREIQSPIYCVFYVQFYVSRPFFFYFLF